MSNMSIEEYVAKKLKTGTYKLVNNERGTSAMWSIFALVAKENESVLDGFVYCRQCHGLIKYSKKTKYNAYRHKCYVDLKSTNETTIDEDDDTQDDPFIESDPISATVESNDIEKEGAEDGDPRQKRKNKHFQRYVEMQIKKGVYQLKDKYGCRSPIWSFYKRICKEDGSTVAGLLWCPGCERLLADAKSTSNLARHKCILKDQQQEQPPAKRTRGEDADDVISKESNEEFTFLSESEDTFVEDKLTSMAKANPQIDEEEEEYVTSESEFFSVVKIENEKIVEDDTTWEEEGHSLNQSEDAKNCSKQKELEQNVKSGVYSLMGKPKAKSMIWSIFDLIVQEDGTIAEGYVCCRVCKRLLKFNGKSTSNLNRHKCYMLAARAAEQKKVNEDHKIEAINVGSLWLLQDCLPCNIIEGKGFRKMLNFFIKLGAVYGENIDIADLLPDATTIAENIRIIAEEKKSKIKPQIEKICNDVSVTVDLWADYYLNRHFLRATLHFQRNFELSNIKLGIKSMDIKTSEQDVRNKLVNLLYEFGVSNMENIVFVTDSQSLVEDALISNSRLTCSYYLFSKVVDNAIERTSELNELFCDCKSIVAYCKQNQIQMAKSSACTVQCGSKYVLIKSIAENWDQVQDILDRLAPQLFTKEKFVVLSTVVQLCQKFEVIFKKLQGNRSPSLCFVIPSINCIRAFCECKGYDDPAISAFKSSILNCLENTWLPNITLWHKAAFFLYPPANKEQTDDLDDIREFCIQQIMKMDQNAPKNEKATNTELDSSSTMTPPKSVERVDTGKSTINEDISFFFPTLVKKSLQTVSKSPAQEVARYSIDYVMIDENFNVLQWWQQNSTNYPRLSKLALRILSIPASNMATQRAFALTGNIVSENLNKFSSKTVDNILFLNSIQEKNC